MFPFFTPAPLQTDNVATLVSCENTDEKIWSSVFYDSQLYEDVINIESYYFIDRDEFSSQSDHLIFNDTSKYKISNEDDEANEFESFASLKTNKTFKIKAKIKKVTKLEL